MKTNSIQQEILLVTRAGFPSREFCENNDEHNYNHLSEQEKLVAARWNGILLEIFPEIYEQHPANRKLCLREMNSGSLFIELKFGEIYLESETQFSIDPCSFLPMQILS